MFADHHVAFVWPEPKPSASAPQFAEDSTTPAQPVSTASKEAKPRGAYRNALRTYMADRDLTALVRQGKDAIAADFIDYCRRKKQELFAKLPKAREIAKQVQKILDDRRTKRQTDNASNHSQTPARSPNRS